MFGYKINKLFSHQNLSDPQKLKFLDIMLNLKDKKSVLEA